MQRWNLVLLSIRRFLTKVSSPVETNGSGDVPAGSHREKAAIMRLPGITRDLRLGASVSQPHSLPGSPPLFPALPIVPPGATRHTGTRQRVLDGR